MPAVSDAAYLQDMDCSFCIVSVHSAGDIANYSENSFDPTDNATCCRVMPYLNKFIIGRVDVDLIIILIKIV